MFFEGSEKKAEIIVDASRLSLLEAFDDAFWSDMVHCCHAQILSSIQNEQCKAYLLSESSLFVWADRLLVLTCGETRLVRAVEFFLTHLANTPHQGAVEHVIYQRKNEYLPQAQHSSFDDDVRLLNRYVPGKAWRFGEMHGHHNYLFHQQNDYQADSNDQTWELLLYSISKDMSAKLTAEKLQTADVRQLLAIDRLLPGFIIDDHVFEPFGYSLNAIKGDQYLTIHVTPQAHSSYISFESNINLVEQLDLVLGILKPAAFDLITFNANRLEDQLSTHLPLDYVSKERVRTRLDNGFEVSFGSYIHPQNDYRHPVALDTATDTGDHHAL